MRHSLIFLITSLLVTAMLLLNCTVVVAEGQSQPVYGKRIERAMRLLRGQQVTPGAEDWQNICKRYEKEPIPAADKPTAAVAASLGKCSSYELYFGFKQPADPVKARLCAFDEIEKQRAGGLFAGDEMLMMMYANGVGAKRNLPLAIKLACTLAGAPAEMEERITHLEQLRKKNWQGTNFSLCDDITSGLMQGYCASHFENFEKIKRNKKLKAIQADWSKAELADYVLLRKAADHYIQTHVEYEVDESGTARVAIAVEAEAYLEDEFLSILHALNRGKLPSYSEEQFKAADLKLNKMYKTIQKMKETDVIWGSVSKDGIKDTQRKWIRYRDAWVAFCHKQFPNVQSAGIKTLVTNLRIELLKPFAE